MQFIFETLHHPEGPKDSFGSVKVRLYHAHYGEVPTPAVF
jgi:hypothetical protein